ncbi:hypothetical protein SSX86_019829 [Deinandra increscens subsp. villosa]|uniref:Uncharacterized protein n=1 Tax=Deinandra increscens subsp. villosa TaxID=3103831 RepID=A0AAP0GUX0_9ASTR
METTAGGRAMVALCPLKGGEIVLRDSPILLYSAIPFHSDNHPDSHGYCSNCFTTIAQQSQDVSCSTCGCRFLHPRLSIDRLCHLPHLLGMPSPNRLQSTVVEALLGFQFNVPSTYPMFISPAIVHNRDLIWGIKL